MTEANIETVVDVNEVTLYIYSEFTPKALIASRTDIFECRPPPML